MVSSLWKACQDGDSARVDELLTDVSQDIEIKDHNGVTPLILAVKGGYSTIVQALLNRGADPNNASAQGRPDSYTADPYILQQLAVARGEIPSYPEPAIHPQYYSYPQYYPYVQDPWYLAHHPQQTPQQEDRQLDPADPASNTTATNPNSGNPPTTSMNQPSHPSLPPPEIARNIPCRYFPACRYGSSCVFLHPSTPYFPGPLPPPAQYPHMYYPPLTFPLQATATPTAGSAAAALVDSSDEASAQPSTVQHPSSDQNGGADSAQNTVSVSAVAQPETNVPASNESANSHPPAASGPVFEGGPDHARSPTSPTSYAHPGMLYMYPSMHPPHSQDGLPVHTVPPPHHHYPHYPPPPPGTTHSVVHSHPPPQSQPQSNMPLPPPHQHVIPPPPLAQENPSDPQQPQQQPPHQQGQLLLENSGQLPTPQSAQPSHVMPYPPPPHVYPTPLHPSWAHIPPPPHHHHQPQVHPGVHPHHPMHAATSIPPHPALATGMPIHPLPGIPGAMMPVPATGPGGIAAPSGPGSFAPRGARGGRRASAAFRNGGDREGRDRGDRDRDRDRDRGDRFSTNLNGHYHGGGPHHSRKPPCLFFPNGKCRNGDECRFSHVLPDASNGGGLNGSASSLSPNGPVSGHRHSQSLSYRRSGYMNGQHSNTHLPNGVGVDGEASSSPTAGAGIGANANTGLPPSIDAVDAVLNAMTLESADGFGGGRRQSGARRGKHHGPHTPGGGGGYSHSHGHAYGHNGGNGGHALHRSLSASPSRGQQQQRVPTADDFPVLGGSSTNGAGSSTTTSATGRTTPIHPISNGASNYAGGAAATTTTGVSGAGATTTIAPAVAAHAVVPNGWSTPLVNGGAIRPTAAQVVKEGMANGHGHAGAWGKALPNAEKEKEKEKDPKLKEKEKEVKENERGAKEVKVTA